VRRPVFSVKIFPIMPNDFQENHNEPINSLLSPQARLAVGFFLPVAGAILIRTFASGSLMPGGTLSQSDAVQFLGPIGIISWFLGLRWYGLSGIGLRGQRPLFAGIGFAVLGWVTFLISRILFVGSGDDLGTGFRPFIFLLLFEAFAVQLWVFGLLFRSLADWLAPLTAAVSSGIIFGAVAFLLFQESFAVGIASYLYFFLWGILYGIIRLRTGSILGMVIVQAMQSFTGWVVMLPEAQPDATQFQTFYLVAGFFYLIIIWRLWPKMESDYRV